ncbi:MAG: hypothetical protein HY907_07530 [Deltaproteobacteria bacterium]|nr:hypothetical protein [Deltaproteobacteria bacterium]
MTNYTAGNGLDRRSRLAAAIALALAAGCGSAGSGSDDDVDADDDAIDSAGEVEEGDGGDEVDSREDGDGRDGDGGEVPVTCGDGIRDPDEDCDDGNRVPGDGCENDCTWSCTSDGDCDDGAACSGTETCADHACVAGTPLPDGDPCTTAGGEPGACRDGTCTSAACGNGVVDTGEDCDDGNTAAGDGCEPDCSWTCAADPDCDDGNPCTGAEACTDHVCVAGTPPPDGDPCTTGTGAPGACRGGLCADAACGNALVDPGEACDDGNADNTDACLSDCTAAACGDGFVRTGLEDCDTDVPRACATTCSSTGSEACTACAWEGLCTPPGEVCNAADDDCDAATDNGFDCAQGATLSCTTTCGSTGSNVCTAACAVPATCAPPVEACNAADDDCDTLPDNGFACVRGSAGTCTTSCGSTGSQFCDTTCSWGLCAPPIEACNGTDDDCDTAPDDGFTCARGTSRSCTTSCATTGTETCDTTCSWGACAPPVETCNGADDDCDTTVDNGFACLAGTTRSCTTSCGSTGTQSCDATCNWGACLAPVETCNGADDDCDGATDEGNPGGGVSCGPALGGCVAVTACVGGAVVCRGTFVSPAGLPTNPGTQAAPLDTVAAAQANAAAIGGGADVCLCDPPAAGSTTYNENVTMAEGTSVLGGYRCDNWARNIATYVTRIQDQDADGLSFPPGISAVTALDGVTVDGLDVAAGGSTAVTVTDSSPSLTDVTVTGGTAADAVGLRVTETSGGTAAPAILRGTYTATALAGGTATAVRLEASAPQITNATIGAGGAGGLAAAATSYGIRCIDCAGTTMSGGSVAGGSATTRAIGLYGTGDMTGVTFTTTSFNGGSTTAAGSSSSGVFLESCTGSPAFVTANTFGGFSMGGIFGTRTAFEAEGAACSPRIEGGMHIGCEVGDTCIGVACRTSSPCAILNATIRGSGGPGNRDYGVRCLTGGCASLTGSDVRAGTLSGTGTEGIGLELDGSSPPVDDNRIVGPNNGSNTMPAGRYHAVYLRATRAVLTNNVVEAGSLAQAVEAVRYDLTSVGPALIEPTIHSNTIDYTACTGCGARTGLAVAAGPGMMTSPSGIVRNNVIRHTAAGGITMPVRELDVMADLRVFENNDLYDPTAGGVYVDEGVTTLNIAQVNTTIGTGNIDTSCQLNATWHMPATSPCRNGGTATGAPDHDFDANRRPQESAYDIGADEYVP